MIVCHCHGVRERDIRCAVREGARSERAVARACGAGRGCGGCGPAVQAIIDAESPADAPAFPAFGELAPTA